MRKKKTKIARSNQTVINWNYFAGNNKYDLARKIRARDKTIGSMTYKQFQRLLDRTLTLNIGKDSDMVKKARRFIYSNRKYTNLDARVKMLDKIEQNFGDYIYDYNPQVKHKDKGDGFLRETGAFTKRGTERKRFVSRKELKYKAVNDDAFIAGVEASIYRVLNTEHQFYKYVPKEKTYVCMNHYIRLATFTLGEFIDGDTLMDYIFDSWSQVDDKTVCGVFSDLSMKIADMVDRGHDITSFKRPIKGFKKFKD